MPRNHRRIDRERLTARLMIQRYCRGIHRTPDGSLCPQCQELTVYAMERLDRCKFRENKPTCARCPVHCYQPAMRERVREVMRYAGPRMMLRHPLLAIWHLMDGFTGPS